MYDGGVMKGRLFERLSAWGLTVGTVILLGLLLFFRYKLGVSRYFDSDEYAHLHWGYSFLIGERPYKDFFYLFPPFFLFPMATIIAIFGRTVSAIINARIFIFGVFLLASGALFFLIKKLRNTSVALFTLSVFVFLPIPYDKMIEVRPDLPATALALAALSFFIKAKEAKKGVHFFLSGLAFGLSLGFVPKTLFFLAPVVIICAYDFYIGGKSKKLKGFYKNYLLFALGGILPAILLWVLIISWGKPQFAIYSMTRMASDVTSTLGKKFYMRPDIFFYPNDTFYALPGISSPLIFNLIIYVVASFWGIWKFLSSLSHQDSNKSLREFVTAGAFMVNLYAFVRIYPLKHSQYIIMFAPFIAFYFTDFIFSVIFLLKKRIKLYTKLQFVYQTPYLLIAVLLLYIGYLGKVMYEVKIKWTNTASVEKLNKMLTTIPADAAVFDLTGETVFFRNGYYFCCLPYGQYEEALGFSLPNIERDMATRGTGYVHAGTIERLNVIPNMQAKYIRENFTGFYPDASLLVRKD